MSTTSTENQALHSNNESSNNGEPPPKKAKVAQTLATPVTPQKSSWDDSSQLRDYCLQLYPLFLADSNDKDSTELISDVIGIHKSQSPFVADNFPSFNGLLDLRLLSGDLDEPNSQSDVLKSILQITGSTTNSGVIPLLGVSGAGKTKAIFDVMDHHYTIYFDVVVNCFRFFANLDQRCATAPENQVVSVELDESNRTNTRPIIICEFLARICLLISLYLHKIIKSPSDWKKFQISLHLHDPSNNFLYFIRKHLLKSKLCNLDNFHDAISWVQGIVDPKRQVGKLIVAIDQADLLVEKGTQYFRSQSSTTTRSRGFISPVLQVLRQYIKIIVAGTLLCLNSLDEFGTHFKKDTSEKLGVLLFTITNFRNLSATDSRKLLGRLLSTTTVKSHEMDQIAKILQGRVIMITSFVTRLEKTKETTDIVERAREWFVSGWKEVVNEYQLKVIEERITEVYDLIIRYLNQHRFMPESQKPVNIDDSVLDWMNLGLCYPIQDENNKSSIHFEILEFMVFCSVMNKLGKELVQNMFLKQIGSEAGYFLEHLVCLNLWLLNGTHMKEIECFRGIKELENVVFKATSLDYVSKFDELLNLDVGSLCFPSNYMGPDHIWIISKSPFVIMLVQDKQSVKNNVDTSTTIAGIHTTEIDTSYKNLLQDAHKNKIPIVMIRLHVFLPNVANSADFESGKTQVHNMTVAGVSFKQVRIDVDLSHLTTCGLFPNLTMWKGPEIKKWLSIV